MSSSAGCFLLGAPPPPWVFSWPSDGGGFRGGLSCLSWVGFTSLPLSRPVSGAFPLSRAFPVPVAVLAQVSWAAARISLPGSPLTLVGLPGFQAAGAGGRVKRCGMGLPGAAWELGSSDGTAPVLPPFSFSMFVWLPVHWQSGKPGCAAEENRVCSAV